MNLYRKKSVTHWLKHEQKKIQGRLVCHFVYLYIFHESMHR